MGVESGGRGEGGQRQAQIRSCVSNRETCKKFKYNHCVVQVSGRWRDRGLEDWLGGRCNSSESDGMTPNKKRGYGLRDRDGEEETNLNV